MTTSLLRIRNLAFSRDGEAILDRVDLELSAGELLLVRGANGTGKTTLLRILAGLLRPEACQAQFRGRPCGFNDPDYLSNISYLGHQLAIKEDLTCAENLSFWAALAGSKLNARTTLAAAGLAGYARSMARELSAGQHKRLALARLPLDSRVLWLLDEPYSNLDSDGIALVDRFLSEHLDRGGAALATSHGTFIPAVNPWREITL